MLEMLISFLDGLLLWVLLAHFVASVLSVLIKSHVIDGYFNWFRYIVNLVALNFGRARNEDYDGGLAKTVLKEKYECLKRDSGQKLKRLESTYLGTIRNKEKTIKKLQAELKTPEKTTKKRKTDA